MNTETPEVKLQHKEECSILALCGSLRKDSYNLRLLQRAKELAPEKVTMQIWHDLKSIPPFNEDVENAQSTELETIEALRGAVRAANGLIISTPEYNRGIPGQLKNVIDWLSRPSPDEVLVGKPIVIIGATAGAWGTRLAQSSLRQVLTATESLVITGGAELFVRHTGEVFDAQGGIADAEFDQQIKTLMNKFREWIDMVSKDSS